MVRYICHRLLAAIPIIVGVLLVTFLLFHCAAGDPAAVMAGKNASAREVEDLRRELRLDRPLFWGYWRHIGIFAEENFTASPGGWTAVPGSEWQNTHRRVFMRLAPSTTVRRPAEWPPESGETMRLRLRFRGVLWVNDTRLAAPRWRRATVALTAPAAELTFRTEADAAADLAWYRAERRQTNPFQSQFMAALREVVDLRRHDDGRLRLSFFNFGRTVLTREPIRQVLLNGLGPSLALMVPIFGIELALSLLIAMTGAFWRGRWPDSVLVVLSVAGMSVSYLVYILVGQYVLGYLLNLFPVWGYTSWRHLLLPVIVGVASGLGGSVRFYRSVFLNELYRDHVRTALAKGCSPWRVMVMHVLPNALIPVLTRVAVVLPFLFTGSLLLESFFGIPGLGYAGITALANADLQLLKALVLLGSLLFVGANIAADIGYALVDPRVTLR